MPPESGGLSARYLRFAHAGFAAQSSSERLGFRFRRQLGNTHAIDERIARARGADFRGVAAVAQLVVKRECGGLRGGAGERHLPFTAALRGTLARLNIGFLRPLRELLGGDQAERLRLALLAAVELPRLVEDHRLLALGADLDFALDQAGICMPSPTAAGWANDACERAALSSASASKKNRFMEAPVSIQTPIRCTDRAQTRMRVPSPVH